MQSLNVFLFTVVLLRNLCVQTKFVHHSSAMVLFFKSRCDFIKEVTEEQIHGSQQRR